MAVADAFVVSFLCSIVDPFQRTDRSSITNTRDSTVYAII